MNEWQDNGWQESIYFDSDGKVLGSISGSYSHSRFSASVYGKGYIGEYMTKEQAKKAVERVGKQENSDGR